MIDLRPFLIELPALDLPLPAHSPIGPSGASRLFACPASLATAELVRRTNPLLPPLVFAAADRGTREHSMVEAAIRTFSWPEIIPDDDGNLFGLSAQIYIEVLSGFVRHATRVHGIIVEAKLDGRRLHPLFFGTVDAAVLWEDARGRLRLSIIDLKTGKFTIAANSIQLVLYAALLLMDPRTAPLMQTVWLISTTVVQPNSYPMPPSGPVRTAKFTRGQILDATLRYLDVATAAIQPDALIALDRHTGDHCLFCPAKPACPSRLAYKEDDMRAMFDLPIDQQLFDGMEN